MPIVYIILIFCIDNVVRSENSGYIVSGDMVGSVSIFHQNRSIHLTFSL